MGCKCLQFVARERRSRCRRMERHSRINVELTGTPIYGVQVSPIHCARAALAVQAHGTPLAHKCRVDGSAHLRGASVSNSLRASSAHGAGAWNATRA